MQSKGGKARAKKLDAKTRKEIASKAAKAKWSLPRAQWGAADNKLSLGNQKLECYVLDNGTRVLSGRGMQEALGLGQSHGAILKGFLSQEYLKPFIENDLAMELNRPIRFIRPGRGGVPAVAYEATILPRICDAVLEARKRSPGLNKQQREIADQCEIITRVLAKVGIIALVDEVTGYQEIRDKLALQKILDKYIKDEWSKWTRRFNPSFYKELFRLKELSFPDGEGTQKPQYVGHWTNDIVYNRMAPKVLSELKKKNPRTTSGGRARKHHQHFTEDYGVPELKQHISNVTFLMKTCHSWDEFKRKLDIAAPKFNETIPMDFEEG